MVCPECGRPSKILVAVAWLNACGRDCRVDFRSVAQGGMAGRPGVCVPCVVAARWDADAGRPHPLLAGGDSVEGGG